MSNLETRVAEWRARMARALPKREEVVDELEEHLRERVAELESNGKSDDDAFAIAEAGLGAPQILAREFNRIPGSCRPGLICLPALGLLLAFFYGNALWHTRLPVTVLLVSAWWTTSVGWFGIFGGAFISTGAFIRVLRRPLTEHERGAVRRLLTKLAWVAGVGTGTGWALTTMSIHELGGTPFVSVHVRAGGVFVSACLLILCLSRRSVSDRGRWITALLPALVFISLNLGRTLRVADTSVTWVCVAFFVGHIFFLLPRIRIRIERLHEQPREAGDSAETPS